MVNRMNIARLLVGLLVAAVADHAYAQQFPLTMPPNSVYGRLDSITGPGQAISLNVLSSQVFSNVPTAPFGTKNNQAASTTFVQNAFAGVTMPALVGDGVTDNVAAINAAITARAAAGGGIVQLLPGRFGIGSATIALASNVGLRGSGAGTVLVRVGGLFLDLVLGVGVNNSFISDLTIDANADDDTNNVVAAGYSVGSTDVAIDRVRVIRPGKFALGFNGVTRMRIADNYVNRVTPRSTNNTGISGFNGNNSSYVLVTRNRIINTGTIFETSYSKITFNTITGTHYGAGVAMTQSSQTHDNEIADNTLTDSVGIDSDLTVTEGIENWSPRTLISRNIVARNAGVGITQGGQNSIVTDNIVYDNGTMGTAGAAAGISSAYFDATFNGNNSYIGGNRVFNTLGAAGSQEYAFVDQSAMVSGVVLGPNYFGPGSLGTASLLSSHALNMPDGFILGTASLIVGPGVLGLAKRTASASAPGAAGAKLELVCGTGAGTAKLIAYAGTSTTPSTVLDNIGAGVAGC